MWFDPLVSWIVPVFGFLSDRVDSLVLSSHKQPPKQTYPEPHRDPKTGQVIIENSLLYNEDVEKYGHYQAHQWVKQGKYNLTPEELEKEKQRIRKELKELYNLPDDNYR